MSWSRGNSASSVSTSSDIHPRGDDPALHRPLLDHNEAPSGSAQAQGVPRYGAVDSSDPAVDPAQRQRRRSSPEVRRQDSLLNRVPEEDVQDNADDESMEEEAEEVEWSLGERGLYSGTCQTYLGDPLTLNVRYAGSYRRVVAMHTFVPLSSLLLLGFLAICPLLFWKFKSRPLEAQPPYFASPIPEVVLASSVWALAYLLRTPLFSLVSFLFDRALPILTTLVFNASHVLLYNFFRLAPLPILRLRDQMQHSRPTWHDPVFYRVWWISLGWATIDVAVGIWQSYAQISLYRSVMVPADRVPHILAQGSALASATNLLSSSEEALPLSPRQEAPKAGSGRGTPMTFDDAIRLAVDQDLEQLVNMKEREDMEDIYGLPVIVCFMSSFPVLHELSRLMLCSIRKSPCLCPACNASALSYYPLETP